MRCAFRNLFLCLAWTVAVGGVSATGAEPLPGTKLLEQKGDLASEMVDGIDRFLLKEIDAAVDRRARHWKRDFSSPEKYTASIAPNRERFKKYIGVIDSRVSSNGLELVTTTEQSSLVGRGTNYEIHAVRWPVFAGVHGEGLLLKPADAAAKPTGYVVAIPDADQTPEMLCGLIEGIPASAQYARRLAESGCVVVIPTLIDRADTLSISGGGARPTNQPHREFVYRPAFEMGRHVIGYEVQKVLAVVDWFVQKRGDDQHAAKIGLFGYGEGGLLSLYASAVDTRVDAAVVSGYFGNRSGVWAEPIYRNVWGLLDEFGDAELASLVVPRLLIVEASQPPQVAGPPAPHDNRAGAAPGAIPTPSTAELTGELNRVADQVRALAGAEPPLVNTPADGLPGADASLTQLLQALGSSAATLTASGPAPTKVGAGVDATARLHRQFNELTEHTQEILAESEYTRRTFWNKADRNSRSVEKWQTTTVPYRDYFYDEVIGRFDQPLLPANARTRKVFDEPKYTGYEVVMDVFPDVFAYGILLLPKDLKPGERRPVVVCQHGLEGRPQDLSDPGKNNPSYNQYALRLAERGFITYAPQNPYIFYDRFRTLQRKMNPLKKTLFSVIVPQHQQTVDWLASLPMVDPERIGFYGLSYGGKTAMRVPALVPNYCLSICSADFDEWIWKNASTRSPYSYVGTMEYEIFEWDLGNTFNYAEMAGLIAPRPFMVERGHRDGVAPDEWVAYEFARVRLLYADLKIADRTELEFFDGPHTIHGVGTFNFLHKHLRWPAATPTVPLEVTK